ncbi:MAG: hypothetical protein COB02_18345 [Candidatus Cloacimonadota bacterium]|nr:MAG: hypothetical protein COB02_18345 [Candidatus Cloacimonadota bacterium]
MFFLLIIISVIFTIVALFGLALNLFDYKQVKYHKEKETNHKDAQIISQLSHQHLGTPSTALVRSKFCDLRFSQKSALYSTGLHQLKKQNYNGIINKVENKFIRIDRSIYSISTMCKSKKSQEYQKDFIESHENKYKQILLKIDHLINSKNEHIFLKAFLHLNEYINAYIGQLESQKLECQKIDDPSIYHWA